jgi:hypothetical protein
VAWASARARRRRRREGWMEDVEIKINAMGAPASDRRVGVR